LFSSESWGLHRVTNCCKWNNLFSSVASLYLSPEINLVRPLLLETSSSIHYLLGWPKWYSLFHSFTLRETSTLDVTQLNKDVAFTPMILWSLQWEIQNFVCCSFKWKMLDVSGLKYDREVEMNFHYSIGQIWFMSMIWNHWCAFNSKVRKTWFSTFHHHLVFLMNT